MAKERKRHTQVPMKFRTWGGARKGAGRPAQGPRPSERHTKRPPLRASHPVHVVLRAASDIGSLRVRAIYAAIREATVTAAKHEDFRIVHFSIQRSHLHLMCEAANRNALSKGIKSFAGSAAKHINRAVSTSERRRTGTVFPDRYHLRILTTPRAVRNCIAYVLNNWRHHGEDRAAVAAGWTIDPFSSGATFRGWKELEGVADAWTLPATYRPLVVWEPKTWLLREGWLRHRRIGAYEVPGEGAVE